MSFLRAARAARADQSGLRRIFAASVVALAGLSLSCGASTPYVAAGPNHDAYVTLPANGSVLQLKINGTNGVIKLGAQTPIVEGTSPTGVALSPSKKFLYAVNSRANTISIFNVGDDGSLTLSATPTPVDEGPNAAVVDPTGKYLLVTNNFANSVSVFSIDANTGALAELTGSGSPFFANLSPTNIAMAHSGNFVYVTNPGIGMVTGFSFANGVLTQVPGSPVVSGTGAAALAVDGSDRYLYVANPSANNPLLASIGNISGFNIDPGTGALSPILGSPFTSTLGTGPTAITLDPSGRFVYATTPGSTSSIWCFAINSTNGQLTAASGSPFSLAAGGLFAFFDPSGSYFYIGNQSAKAIEGYSFNSSTGALKLITGSPFSTEAAPGGMVFTD